MAQEGLFSGRVEPVGLEDEVKKSYLDYAMSVIVGRALPDVRDGLKPVQRRILWSMLESGLRPDRPHRKSVSAVGEVLKKYHPHGDSSVYDALVRLAQDWVMRAPLIDGHGNFGSVDGDPAAAYRYCVTGETLVHRPEGHTIRIDQIVPQAAPNSEHDIALKVTGRNGDPVMATKLFHSGDQPALTVTTSVGATLSGSHNHPVLCLEAVVGIPMLQWRLLSELQPGALVAMSREALGYSGAVPDLVWDYLDSVPSRFAEEVSRVVRPVVDGRFTYATVIAVEDAGVQPVFSLRVDADDHAFVTNGFISHNTEARLAPMAMELLKDIDSETVDFVPNFDGYEQEPTVLPARFPGLLVNGAAGIAVGMATNIPPHNLGEIIDAVCAMIDEPDISAEDLMQHVKGPDFPTGAQIIGSQGIRDAYTTGRGSVKVRAVARIEEGSNNRLRIVVTELPYQVNKARLAEKIADLVRSGKIKDIADLKDESSREGMRLVVDLKRGANAQVVLNQLYKNTQLQDSFSALMLSLVDGVPKVLNLAEMLGHYLDHQFDVTTRRAKYDLRKAEERDHILKGLLIALDHLDEVIKIIRASADADQARTKLISKFKLSEIQANHILDMPLRRLTKLAKAELEQEHKDLAVKIKYLTALLKDPKKIYGVVREELEAVRAKFANPRRTAIRPEEGEMDVLDLIPEEDVIITVTRAGYIKRQPLEAYRSQGRGGKGVRGATLKEEDVIRNVFTTTTHHWLLIFTTRGKVYRVKVHEVPESSRTARGMFAANLPGVVVDADERISAVLDLKEYSDGKYLVFGTRKGMVKKTALPEYDSPRTGLAAINIKDGDELIDVLLTDGKDDIFMVSRNGQTIRFAESTSRPMGRATAGVIGMRLREGDEVLAIGTSSAGVELISVTANGYGKRTVLDQYPRKGRGGLGVIGHSLTKKTGLLAGAFIGSKDQDVFLVSSSGIAIRVPADQIRRVGRASQGVRTMRVEEGAHVAAMAPVTEKDDEDSAASQAAALGDGGSTAAKKPSPKKPPAKKPAPRGKKRS